MVKGETLDQSRSLFDVTVLTGGEDEPQGISQTIHRYMDLGGKTSSAAPESLCLLSTGSFEGSGSTGVSTNDGAVEHEVFHIGGIDKVLAHSLKNSLGTPAGESFVDAVPIAVLFRKQSPLGTAPTHPKHCFDEAAAIALLSDIQVWAGAKELDDLSPYLIL
jgi:hypothetical protein